MKVRKTILREVNGCNDKAMLTKSLALILFYQMRVGMDVNTYCKMDVLKNDFKKIIELQDTLLSFIIVNTQERKDFVKDVFDKLKSPKTLKEYKKARKFVKEKYPQCDKYTCNDVIVVCDLCNRKIHGIKQ